MSDWEEQTMNDLIDAEYDRLCEELGIQSQEHGVQLVNDYYNNCQYAIDILDDYSLEDIKMLKGEFSALNMRYSH